MSFSERWRKRLGESYWAWRFYHLIGGRRSFDPTTDKV